jgi:hypothetical protein
MKKRKQSAYRLPQYRAPEHLWDEIEKQISSKENTSRPGWQEKLPVHKAPEHVFSQVEYKLRERTSHRKIAIALKAAAFLLLILAMGWVFLHSTGNNQEYIISHHIQVEYQKAGIKTPLSKEEFNLQDYLSQACKTQPSICEKSAYKDLTQQLENLRREEEFLKEEIQRHDDDQLKDHLLQIQKDKEKIHRYIVQLFI